MTFRQVHGSVPRDPGRDHALPVSLKYMYIINTHRRSEAMKAKLLSVSLYSAYMYYNRLFTSYEPIMLVQMPPNWHCGRKFGPRGFTWGRHGVAYTFDLVNFMLRYAVSEQVNGLNFPVQCSFKKIKSSTTLDQLQLKRKKRERTFYMDHRQEPVEKKFARWLLQK